jgi:transcriptional regulator with XRE-family HTH domain
LDFLILLNKITSNSDRNSVEKPRRKPIRKRIKSPFSENLRSTLAERSINLKSAAELAGTSPPVVHAWLNGGMPHDLGAVAKLAKALNCDFQWLVTGTRNDVPIQDRPLSEIFDIQDDPAFSGLFLLEAKRLKRR